MEHLVTDRVDLGSAASRGAVLPEQTLAGQEDPVVYQESYITPDRKTLEKHGLLLPGGSVYTAHLYESPAICVALFSRTYRGEGSLGQSQV